MFKTVIGTACIILAMTTARMVLGEDAQASPVEPKALCESVLGHVMENKFVDAIAVTRTAWLKPMGDSEWSRFASGVYLSLQGVKDAGGVPIGWELVREYRVNETLRRYVYLIKYEKGVLCWQFMFYRPHDVWRLDSCPFNSNLDPLWAAAKTVKPQAPADSDHAR